ncbi:hypothetical protein ACSBR1_043225 [Camellia fascicularis]
MVDTAFTYGRLVNHLCERFGGLCSGSVSMFFRIAGYNKFNMENELDFPNMMCLARSFRVDHVDIILELCMVLSGNKRCRAVSDNEQLERIFGGVGDVIDDVDEHADLLPNFCMHTWKVLLSESWAFGINNVGQCFQRGAAKFQKVLSKYAIECGFQFKFKKNDSVRITAVCIFNESRGCPWSVHARGMNVNGFFYLKKWNSGHTYGVAVRTASNPRMGSELVADVMAERVCEKPLTRPTDVKYHFQKDYGLQVSYRIAWLGVEKARGELFGDHSASFDQLMWYSNAVMEYNPGSYVNLEFDATNKRWFNRLFISFKACIDGFNYCHLLLFLDGTFLKGRFKSNLLAATSKDGNKGYGYFWWRLRLLIRRMHQIGNSSYKILLT